MLPLDTLLAPLGVTRDDNLPSMQDIATFAAGCFWGVEETFLQTPGVLTTEVGYAGGTVKDPTYDMVCTGSTGHAEAVQVTFDPEKVSFEDLLKIFFENHDPTTKNRQGPDVGDQYRSAIFFHTADQEIAAKNTMSTLDQSGKFKRSIVTQVSPFTNFYPAEEYHQQYLRKNGLGSCHI